MSTWGPGNFQSDGALDYLHGFQQELIERIEAILANPKRREADEEGEWSLMPAIAILSIVSKAVESNPVDAKTVRRWRDDYLAEYKKYDKAIPENKEFNKKRIVVLKQTFDEFADRMEKFAT
jgi:hypothetical protein